LEEVGFGKVKVELLFLAAIRDSDCDCFVLKRISEEVTELTIEEQVPMHSQHSSGLREEEEVQSVSAAVGALGR